MRSTAFTLLLATLAAMVMSPEEAGSAQQVENDRGVVGYKGTPALPWCDYIKHDPDRPLPLGVDPGPFAGSPDAPSDAVVLFDGTDLTQWASPTWEIADAELVAGEGGLTTKQAFGDFQLHLEFKVPETPSEELFNRGNSGVYIMGQYEVQIFDSHVSHAKQVYPDGQCAAIYGDTPPRVNACRRGGEWQTYDLLFTAPRFADNRLERPARVTLLHNNVLVHLDAEVHAPTGHLERFTYELHPATLPFFLQGHGSPVRYRNIWIRPLSE